MTYLSILSGAIIASVISLRWRNIAFSLSATLVWGLMFFYHLQHSIGLITLGTFSHDFLTYTYLVAAAGMMTAYIVSGRKGYSGFNTERENAEMKREMEDNDDETPIAYMNPEQYRRFIHGRRTSTRRVRR